jgi:hypothetical protein
VARTGEKIKVYRVLVGRPRRRWEDEIRMGLREIGWRVRMGFDWLKIGTTARR